MRASGCRAWTLIGVLPLILALPGPRVAAAADLAEATRWLHGGQYARAERAFGDRVRSRQRAQALLGLGRVYLQTGRPADAARAARKAATGKHLPDARTLEAEALLHMGKVPEAEALLRPLVAAHPAAHRALLFFGLALREQGKGAEAKRVFYELYDAFEAGRMDKGSAEALSYLGQACRYTDNFRDAADTFADAHQVDPRHLETLLYWAEISLEKYEAGYAESQYRKALKINPHHAGALVGLARVKLEQSGEIKEVLRLLERAEKTDPASLDAAVVRAEILIDAERNAEAEALLTRALQRNGRHLPALSMLAASFYLRDDIGGFERMRAKVLGLNPTYTELFRTTVRLAVRQHRYAEAIGLSKRAIKIDPGDWYSLSDLGTNYLRMGNDAEGLKYLKEAWKGDRFNVRTFNLLNLFEDVVAKQYTFVSSGHFRLRMHREEADLLQRTVVPLLERAYGIFTKKYRFSPTNPITVELFRDPNHYAVRTVGLPGLGALGVCFGQVITAISPTSGRFNWGQVLWHELSHVFTIQMSRSRVPRWLTEGLAEMEPVLERPEWKRENDFDVYRALRSGRLMSLTSMDTAFTQARTMQDMVVAYHQGGLLTQLLVKTWGLPRMIEALRSFARGRRAAQVLPAVTGIDLPELDRRFRAHLTRKLAHYGRSWYFDPEAFQDLDGLARAARDRPDDLSAQAAHAAALLLSARLDQASKTAQAVLVQDAKHKLALYVAARVALARESQQEAAKLVQRLLAAGGDGYETRLILGKLALARKHIDDAARHLNAAKRLDPEQAPPYGLLADAYLKAKREPEAIAELKALARLDQQSLPPVLKLVQLLSGRKDHAGVRTFGQMAYYIHPASAKLHRALAEACAAPAPRPDLDRAIWHLQVALLCRPDRPADLHAELARIYLLRNDKKSARRHVEQALATDPGHARAQALRKKLH